MVAVSCLALTLRIVSDSLSVPLTDTKLPIKGGCVQSMAHKFHSSIHKGRGMKIEDLAGLVQRKKGSMGVRATAAEIGISPTTLSRIERGHIPDMGTLEKICTWLEEDMAKFTGISGLQIAFKKHQAVSPSTAKSLAYLIELASKQFSSKIEAEGH
jgi:transcriptional regulator with XRE-family HTH domain